MNDLHSPAISDIFKRTFQNWRAVHLVHVKLNLLQKALWIQSSEIKFWFLMLATHLQSGFEKIQWVWGFLRLCDGRLQSSPYWALVHSIKTELTNICSFLLPKHRGAKPVLSQLKRWLALNSPKESWDHWFSGQFWAIPLSVCCKK